MYTKLDEMRFAKKVIQFLDTHPDATRKDIILNLYTNLHRLKALEKDGYVKLPEPTPRAERNKKYIENLYAQKAAESMGT
jgi:hypothetical protein